jgi:hypothetical protein
MIDPRLAEAACFFAVCMSACVAGVLVGLALLAVEFISKRLDG